MRSRTLRGCGCDPNDFGAVRWCAVGALNRSGIRYMDDDSDGLVKALTEAMWLSKSFESYVRRFFTTDSPRVPYEVLRESVPPGFYLSHVNDGFGRDVVMRALTEIKDALEVMIILERARDMVVIDEIVSEVVSEEVPVCS